MLKKKEDFKIREVLLFCTEILSLKKKNGALENQAPNLNLSSSENTTHGFSKKKRKIDNFKILSIFKNIYRPLVAIFLLMYWFLPFSKQIPNNSILLLFIIGFGVFTISVIILNLIWKNSHFDKYSYSQSIIEILLIFGIIRYTGGADSFAYIFLLVPIIFGAYRYSASLASLLLVIVLVSGIIVNYLIIDSGNILLTTKKYAENMMILFITFSAVGYIRLFLKNRLENLWSKVQEREACDNIDAIFYKACEAVKAKVIVLFECENDSEKYLLSNIYSNASYQSQKDTSIYNKIALKKDFVSLLEGKYQGTDLIYCATSLDFKMKEIIQDMSIKEFGKKLYLKENIQTMIAIKSQNPYNQKGIIAIGINKITNAPFFMDEFRKEDQVLLGLIINTLIQTIIYKLVDNQKMELEKINMEQKDIKIKLECQANEIKIKNAEFEELFDYGVQDEISIINTDLNIERINMVKGLFFGIIDKDKIENDNDKEELKKLIENETGKKCHKVFHDEDIFCDACQTFKKDPASKKYIPQNTIKPWTMRFNHKKSGRFHVASIKSKKLEYPNGKVVAIETVHDFTNEYRSEKLKNFMIEIRDLDKKNIEEELSIKIVNLVFDCGFPRCILFEYERNNRSFAYLASSGFKHKHEFRSFRTPLEQLKDKAEYDHISKDWVDKFLNKFTTREPIKPIVIRRSKNGAKASEFEELKEGKDQDCYKIFSVNPSEKLPFEKELCRENISEVIDIPLVFNKRLIGKLSIDTFNESKGKQLYSFNKEDCNFLYVISRLISYIWESSNRQQFDNYLAMIEHQITPQIDSTTKDFNEIRESLNRGQIEKDFINKKLDELEANFNHLEKTTNAIFIENVPLSEYKDKDVNLKKEIIERCVNMLKLKNGTEDKYREVNLPPENGPILKIDKQKMETVFYNLLNNAFKYSSKEKPIEIKFEKGIKSIRIFINNYGSGIKEEEKYAIFNKFRMGSCADDKKPGFGCGLYISQIIVKNYGGQISVKNKNDPVSFMIELPSSLIVEN